MRFAFEVATARRPLEDEVAILQTVLASHHKHYADRLEEAKKLSTDWVWLGVWEENLSDVL